MCKSYVTCNTEALVESRQTAIAAGDTARASLAANGVSAEQATADLDRLLELVQQRDHTTSAELGQLHRRYMHAAPPAPGERATVAYRLGLLFLDRWNAEHGTVSHDTEPGPVPMVKQSTAQTIALDGL